MPELPEVETRVRQLQAPCTGRTIQEVHIGWPRHIHTPNPVEFRQRICGQEITDLERRGKFLVFQLSTDVLIIHLRMSGDLYVAAPEKAIDKYAHTTLTFDNRQELRFTDVRKFGRVYLVQSAETITSKLGPEPLSKQFTRSVFCQMLSKHKRMLKPLLLDQHFLAGMGNIYTDEALHLSRLHPTTLSNMISTTDSHNLWRNIRKVLRDGIRHGGSSIDWVYKGGSHQYHFSVYGQHGKACQMCDSTIVRTTVSQRGTYYCPKCQPSPKTI